MITASLSAKSESEWMTAFRKAAKERHEREVALLRWTHTHIPDRLRVEISSHLAAIRECNQVLLDLMGRELDFRSEAAESLDRLLTQADPTHTPIFDQNMDALPSGRIANVVSVTPTPHSNHPTPVQ